MNLVSGRGMLILLGGIAGASLMGALLWWATPFTPWASGAIALLVCVGVRRRVDDVRDQSRTRDHGPNRLTLLRRSGLLSCVTVCLHSGPTEAQVTRAETFGAVSFSQRSGSALNRLVHHHCGVSATRVARVVIKAINIRCSSAGCLLRTK